MFNFTAMEMQIHVLIAVYTEWLTHNSISV